MNLGPFTEQSAAAKTAAEEAEETRLWAARDSFPGWEISETFGGFIAVPKGTVIVRAISLDDLIMKLREQA